MRILIANLKLFYQRRFFWVAYFGLLVGLFVCWTLIPMSSTDADRANSVRPLGVMMLMLAVGSLVGNMRRHLTSRMVCLPLPGHRLAWRRFTFLAGLVIAAVGSFVFVGHMGGTNVPSGALAQVLFTAFGANLTIYLIGACTAGRLDVPVGPMAIGHLFIFLGFYGRSHAESCVALTRSVIESPGPIVALSAATGAFVWLWLGRRTYLREAGRARRANVGYLSREGFFLGRARRSRDEGPFRHIWGALYAMSLPGSPSQVCGIMLAFLNTVFVIFATYLRMGTPALVFPVFVIGAMYSPCVPLYGTVSPTAGRDERALATIASLMVFACAAVISVAVPIGALDLLEPILPIFELGGIRFAYTPISLWAVLLLGAVVPVAGLLDLAFYDELYLLLLTKGFLALVVVIAMYVLSSWMAPVPLTCVVVLTVVPWGLCAFGIRRIAMESDLVSQRRRA